MNGKRYSVGVDFGTLSARAVVVDTANGDTVGEAIYEYPHGVMDRNLPDGTPVCDRSAYQHPADYIEALSAIRVAIEQSGVDAKDICGVCIDFTTCTLLPVKESGEPLCFDTKYHSEPHAYVKLWKHHASQPQADTMTKLANERGEEWLSVYGGKISSEWMFPKILETLQNAPEVYCDTARFIDAGDWLNWLLTGVETHSAAFAGYKALWFDGRYPSAQYFAALDGRLGDIIGTKISTDISPVDSTAGEINEYGAKLTGLEVGTKVALGLPDAHASMAGLGVTGEGELLLILGTSGCYVINSKTEKRVSGICGYVKDGIIPGYYTYETGQACLGDGYDRFVKNFVSEQYYAEAKERGINIHALLREKAERLSVGESGLLCLDWFNGNRSILVDGDLSGVILGLTLNTRPEEIYRALIEASAFGTKMIIDNFVEQGIEIKKIYTSGGIARKDAMMMQIYADVTGYDISVASVTQSGAIGSAVYAAVAGGAYADISQASRCMAKPFDKVYKPDKARHRAYARLYEEYKTLHDYFGRGENDVMKRLLDIKGSSGEI